MRRSTSQLCCIATLAWLTATAAQAANPFFAMDNIARGGPDVAPAMLRALGYDGFGGRALDEIMPPAIAARGLKFFNGYIVLSLDPAHPAPDGKLQHWLEIIRGKDTALWVAIREVKRPDGSAHGISAPEADGFVAAQIRAIADVAASHGVRVALYPHAGFWLARVEDTMRIADRLNRPDVGVTFNLCHWLKVEGAERDPVPVLRAALPRLMFVTISGADTGDTRTMSWDRLIQPLDSGSYDLGRFIRQVQATGLHRPRGLPGLQYQSGTAGRPDAEHGRLAQIQSLSPAGPGGGSEATARAHEVTATVEWDNPATPTPTRAAAFGFSRCDRRGPN